MEKISLSTCQDWAKATGYNTTVFTLCGPKGKLKCRWTDAYFGLFEIEERDGIYGIREFKNNSDLWCEDIKKIDNK